MICWNDECPLAPELPERLQGPREGAIAIYNDLQYPRWHGKQVTVLRRSYVWSPELHHKDGTHGFRRYDWKVVQFEDGATMVVDDDKLEVIG